ncbi:cytochrome P450 [Apiospora saccharicola]
MAVAQLAPSVFKRRNRNLSHHQLHVANLQLLQGAHEGQQRRASPQIPDVFPVHRQHPFPGMGSAWICGKRNVSIDKCGVSNAKLTRTNRRYEGQLTSASISLLPGWNIHFFQDRETVREIWRSSSLLSSHTVFRYACKYMFGTPPKWLAILAADDSGHNAKPHPASRVEPQNRAHSILSRGVHANISGPRFAPSLERSRKNLFRSVGEVEAGPPIGDGDGDGDGLVVSDFRRFVHNTVGLSLVQAVFGPSLVRVNPTFMDDVYELDRWLPWLSRGIPSLLMPKAYAARRWMQRNFKAWYAYDQYHLNKQDSAVYDEAYEGSTWMENRRLTMREIQDEDTVASLDSGGAWATTINVYSATIMALIHIARDRQVLERVRGEMDAAFGAHQPLSSVSIKELAKLPLLSSIFAETLRLHVTSFSVVTAPYQDMRLGGRYLFPKGGIGMLSSRVSHLDTGFWNTQEGVHPVNSFWADRFLTDPSDPSSGPRIPGLKNTDTSVRASGRCKAGSQGDADDQPYFSTEGLRESWYPFGGGQFICPERFIARSAMILTCALLARQFDMEVLNKRIEFSSSTYGFGTEQPKHPVQVRLRRRLANA